jgi:hypothetical protein
MRFDNEQQVSNLSWIALGAAILFVTFPANILAGNADEIPAAGRYFLFFIALGLVTLALGWLCVRLVSPRLRPAPRVSQRFLDLPVGRHLDTRGLR